MTDSSRPSVPEPPAPKQPGLLDRLRGLWQHASVGQRLVTAGAGAGTVIGLLAILIPLIVVVTTRPTSTDTVSVQNQSSSEGGAGLESGGLEPIQAGLGAQALGASVDLAELNGFEQYAVPIDAPWAELWAAMNPNEGCVTQTQLDWLKTHGTVIPPDVLTTIISNTADSGSDLTVSEIRPQGQLTLPLGDTVTVEYYLCIGGGDEGIYAHITLGVDPVAVFDSCYTDTDGCYFSGGIEPAPGDPVVFAIRPGETRLLHLSYAQKVDFVGRFVATVSVDGEESTIDLSPGGVDIVAPAVTRPHAQLTIGSDLFNTSCTAQADTEADWSGGCTLEQWLGILAAG